MSVEELRADLESNRNVINGLNGPLTTAPELVALLQGTIWPFIENVVGELAEVDETVGDLYSGAEDILQPETAAQFAAVVAAGLGLVAELEKRLAQNDPNRQKLTKAIAQFKTLAHTCNEILLEVTVPDDDEEDEDGGEDEEGEDEADEADEADEEADEAAPEPAKGAK